MNLHGIASGAVSAVNPMIPATLYQSTGYITVRGGDRYPRYTVSSLRAQVQGLSEKALQHLNELNIGGILRKVYLSGTAASIVRGDSKGGDLLTFNSKTWMVVQVNEQWPDWASVIVQQQVDSVVAYFAIAPSAGEHGAISPAYLTAVASGASQSFTITPAAAYAVDDVLVDDVSVGSVGSYTFSNVTADHTITASFAVPVLPTITSFTATPTSITSGGSSSLAWVVTGATSLSINQGVGAVTPVTTGSIAVSPTVDTTYTLTATNKWGSVTAQASVQVVAAVTLYMLDSQDVFTAARDKEHMFYVAGGEIRKWDAVAQTDTLFATAGVVQISQLSASATNIYAFNDAGVFYMPITNTDPDAAWSTFVTMETLVGLLGLDPGETLTLNSGRVTEAGLVVISVVPTLNPTPQIFSMLNGDAILGLYAGGNSGGRLNYSAANQTSPVWLPLDSEASIFTDDGNITSIALPNPPPEAAWDRAQSVYSATTGTAMFFGKVLGADAWFAYQSDNGAAWEDVTTVFTGSGLANVPRYACALSDGTFFVAYDTLVWRYDPTTRTVTQVLSGTPGSYAFSLGSVVEWSVGSVSSYVNGFWEMDDSTNYVFAGQVPG